MKNKMKNKKALAIHVEMILSFIIFVGFVIFLLAAFPVYKPSKSTLGLDAAERGVSDYVSSNVKYFTVVLNKTVSKTCFCFENNSGIDRVVAMDEHGGIIGSYYYNGLICINDKEDFHSVYSSTEFREERFTGECENLDNTTRGYLIGLEDDISMASYNKIANLTKIYNTDYENLKNRMSIPAGEDFGFRVVDLKGREILNLSAMKNKPAKTQVSARSFPAQIVYENGSFVFAMINVQEW